jgi:hypothetical protein
MGFTSIYLEVSFSSMVRTPAHELSSILTGVFTLLLIQKNSTNLSYRVLLQVFAYKYHKNLRATDKPRFKGTKKS